MIQSTRGRKMMRESGSHSFATRVGLARRDDRSRSLPTAPSRAEKKCADEGRLGGFWSARCGRCVLGRLRAVVSWVLCLGVGAVEGGVRKAERLWVARLLRR